MNVPPGPDSTRNGPEGKEVLKEKLVCSSSGGGTTVFTATGTAGLSGFICDATACVVVLRYGATFPHLDTMLIILLNTRSIIYKLLHTNTSQRHPLLIQNRSRGLETKQCLRFCPPEYV
jgi:hypothetical protein